MYNIFLTWDLNILRSSKSILKYYHISVGLEYISFHFSYMFPCLKFYHDFMEIQYWLGDMREVLMHGIDDTNWGHRAVLFTNTHQLPNNPSHNYSLLRQPHDSGPSQLGMSILELGPDKYVNSLHGNKCQHHFAGITSEMAQCFNTRRVF